MSPSPNFLRTRTFICVILESIIGILQTILKAILDEEIPFRNAQPHQTKYDIALIVTREMEDWRRSYVRDFPNPSPSSSEQEQDRNQDSDLEYQLTE